MFSRKNILFMIMFIVPQLTLCTKTAEQLIKEIAELPKGAGALPELPQERLTHEINEYLKAGGDVNARDSKQRTLLHAVTRPMGKGNPAFTEAIELLLSYNADANLQDAEGKTPLMNLAVRKDMDGAIKLILKSNTLDLLKRNVDGETARQIALKKNQTEAFSLLTNYKAKTAEATHGSLTQSKSETIARIDHLLDDLNITLIKEKQEKELKSKAALVAKQRELEKTIVQIITSFTESGEDLQSGEKDIELLTAAINAHSVAILKALIDKGKLNPNGYRYDATLLDNAIRKDDAEVVRFLSKKVDKSVLEHIQHAQSPLMHIAELIRAFNPQNADNHDDPFAKTQHTAFLNMLTYLLEAGADPFILQRYINPKTEVFDKDIALYVDAFKKSAGGAKSQASVASKLRELYWNITNNIQALQDSKNSKDRNARVQKIMYDIQTFKESGGDFVGEGYGQLEKADIIFASIYYDSPEIFKKLIELGEISPHSIKASEPFKGITLLAAAGLLHNIKILNYLLSIPSIDIDAKGSAGLTAIETVAKEKHYGPEMSADLEVMSLLLQAGANVANLGKYTEKTSPEYTKVIARLINPIEKVVDRDISTQAVRRVEPNLGGN